MAEPVDEIKAIFESWFASLKNAFKKNGHPDLRRSYGGECAAIMLREVENPQLQFFLNNGIALKSLCDLNAVLPELDEATFAHHANSDRNDFSNWIREVIGDKVLAEKISLLDTKEDMAKAVNVRVNWFKRRLG